jgi:hypothetical protein
MAVSYEIGEELDDLHVSWPDPRTGQPRDFSGGLWAFEFKVGDLDSVAVLTKTTGITGAATFPNVVIAFAPDELNIAAKNYTGQVKARRSADNKDLICQFEFPVTRVVT